MIKNNKIRFIISSIVTLLPAVASFFADKFLPEEIAVHWGFSGNADGFASPKVFFLVFPLILLAIHVFCLVITTVIDKNGAKNKAFNKIAFWIIPSLSIVCCLGILAAALGFAEIMPMFVSIFLGFAFIIIGNYMPKLSRNLTAGIKIKWTYSSDENWYATHRFAGKVYVVVGILCLPLSLLPLSVLPYAFIGIILASVLLPTAYSYRFYKKQLANGEATREDYQNGYNELVKNRKAAKITTAIIISITASVLAVFMLTGSLELSLDSDSINMKATYWSASEIKYSEIDSVEYRESISSVKVNGFNSPRLLLGQFRNDELGVFTRYTYGGKKPCIVIKSGGKTYVVGEKTPEETREIYQRLLKETK